MCTNWNFYGEDSYTTTFPFMISAKKIFHTSFSDGLGLSVNLKNLKYAYIMKASTIFWADAHVIFL